jgi:hypothetical protein
VLGSANRESFAGDEICIKNYFAQFSNEAHRGGLGGLTSGNVLSSGGENVSRNGIRYQKGAAAGLGMAKAAAFRMEAM